MLQERIIKDEVYFTDSGFSAFCNRMVAVVFAIVMVGVKGESCVNVNVSVNVNCTVCIEFVNCPLRRANAWRRVYSVLRHDHYGVN